MNPLKTKAIKLRNNGYSYSIISKKLGISKSTLSNWLTRIPFKPNKEVIEKIGKARLKSALHKQKIKFKDIELRKKEAVKDIGILSKRDIFMLGIGLYLGEGTKSLEEIRIVNSDPIIIKLAIKWFKDYCKLERKHFKLAIHGYPDNDIGKTLKFWSKITKIPLNQFGKTIIDSRKNKSVLKKRKLPYGTAHLYIKGGGTLKPGVKSLHRKIMAWIETTVNQI